MNKRGKRYLKIFSFIFLVSALLFTVGNIGLISAAFADNGSLQQIAYDCGTISTANAVYRMNQTANSTVTCFTVSAVNITLDCQGNIINFSSGGTASTYGVTSNQLNTTIKNCNITDGNWTSLSSSRFGVYLTTASANFSTVYNNSVNVNNSIPIYLSGAKFNNVSFNNVSSNSNYGIYLSSASNNSLTRNNASSNTSYAIFLYTLSTNNNLTSNIGKSVSSLGLGIYLDGTSGNNTLINNNGTCNSSVGIQIQSQYNNLTGNNGSSYSNYGIQLSGASYNNLTNNIGVTYSGSYAISVESSSNSNALINNTGISSGSGISIWTNSENNLLMNNTGISSGIGNGITLSSNRTILINNNGTSSTGNGIGTSTAANNMTLINNIGTCTGISTTCFGISINGNNNILTNNTGATIRSGRGGILLSTGATNNLLTNNTGTSYSGSGIYFDAVSYNILINNNGTGNTSFGIYMDSSSDNNLTGNIGISNSSLGIFLSSSFDNVLTGNVGTSNTSKGILLQNSLNNTFLQPTAKGLLAGSYGAYFDRSNNTLFKDCINITGVLYDIYFSSNLTSVNNTFINCSINNSNVLVNSTDGQLITKWYYQAYVNDSSGSALNGVSLTITNVSGTTVISATTNSSGYIPTQQLTDYVNAGGTSSYASNYTITAALSGYSSSSKTFNLTTLQNLNDFLTMSLAPVVSTTPPEESGGSLPPSSGNTYVPAALNNNFWTQTTTVPDSEWQTSSENPQEIITEPEAQILEQQLIAELKTNPNAENQEITIKEITENLSTGERVKVDVKNLSYYVGVASVTADSVVVQVSGSGGGGAIQSLMKVGDTKKFDLNGDGLIDMKIEIVNLEPNQKAGIKISVVYNGLLNAKEIQQYNQNQKSNKLLMFAFIFIGVLIAITIYFRFRKYK